MCGHVQIFYYFLLCIVNYTVVNNVAIYNAQLTQSLPNQAFLCCWTQWIRMTNLNPTWNLRWKMVYSHTKWISIEMSGFHPQKVCWSLVNMIAPSENTMFYTAVGFPLGRQRLHLNWQQVNRKAINRYYIPPVKDNMMSI